MFRSIAALLAMVVALGAAPPLTTIQDVVYKADGSPFEGVLFIEWKSFQANDSSIIGMQSITLPVVNGVVRVQLVPTTNAVPAGYYVVRYNSSGRIQFEEMWAVPPSTVALRLKDVRIPGPAAPGGVVQPPAAETEIPQSSVVGLLNDLSVRPVKGAGYAPSRATVIAADGSLEAVVGNLSDCVRVDGTAGPCGSGAAAGPGFADAETPAGTVNGVNAVFALTGAPLPAESLQVFRNGVLQKAGLDYTLDGSTITFAAESVPQFGDELVASYRIGDASNPAGTAGGALTGTYPNPSLGMGVVSDANVSDVAGIRESKLALNFATHANTNDPSATEKAGLAGTAGVPSDTNRYVTNADPRMTDARAPLGHALLGAGHSDAAAANPVRGDLIVAQGSSPVQWMRLPIGQAGRCLVSNGFDAQWNACLYTGFTAGSVPYVDANGNLASNATRLTWDNSNRKLSIGNNVGGTTVYVYDAEPATGATGLTVRAGQGQGADPLQRWLSAGGAEVGRVEADGRVQAPSFKAASSSARAAWQDAGTATDPTAPSSGDSWYSTAANAHKAVHLGQTHTAAQVLCSSAGTATSSTALTRLGSCTIPANLLKAGDRVDIRFDYAHTGAASQFAIDVRWGGTSLLERTAAAAETAVSGRADAGVHASGAQWNVQSWGTSVTFAASAGNAGDPVAQALTVDFLGRILTAGADVVALKNFTVLRYPAQQNP